jgi:Zn finger protein HypA/HybF involved in hydrogenase expression
MNDLSNFLVESILLEADSVDNKVVVYAGRFQPFHKGHYATYKHLVNKFGKKNVYIGTSNKTDNNKSPFNFREKVMIMNKMFGIPKNVIVQVKNPYVPTEVLKKFDKDTTAFITVVGKKDASRLGGKFFTPYKDNLDFEGYEDKGYVYIAPQQSNPISGTEVRNGLKSGSDEDKKDFFSKRAYPTFNKSVFDFITNTLNEEINISNEIIEDWLIQNIELIKEASQIRGAQEADDGPNYLFPSFSSFDRVSQKRAEKIGYTVLSQIMSDDDTDIDPHPIYPNGPVKAVTPFPAGVIGKTTATNQKDFYGSQAYRLWFKHVTRLATLVGYSVLDSLDNKHDEVEAKKTKKVKDPNTNIVKEDITIPINIGDTVLGGKFKNKRIVVKTIGKNEKGDITINGKPLLKVRIIEEGVLVEFSGEEISCEKCNHSWEIESDDNEKYFCHNCGWDSQKKEYDKEALADWKRVNEELSSADRTLIYQLTTKALKAMPKSQKQRDIIKKLNKVRVANGMKPLREDLTKEELTEDLRKWFGKGKTGSTKGGGWDRYSSTGKKLGKCGDGEKGDAYAACLSKEKANKLGPKGRASFVNRKRADQKKAGDTKKGGNKTKGKKPTYSKTKANESSINEIPMGDLKKIDKFADKQLNPVDVVLTGKHFFDRLNDPRNGKEVSNAELIGFFKRLGKKKKEFVNFLNQYNQVVAKDNRTNLNIPFMKQANKVIAKTIMRKDDFKTSDPEYKFESLPTKVTDKFKAVKSGKPSSEGESDFNKHHQTSAIAKRGSLAEPDTIDFDDDEKTPGHQNKEKDTKKKGYEPVREKKKLKYNEPYALGGGITESLILEGGAYGHMNHPFDTEINLTFGQLKDIVNKALEGNLDLAREKTDGQALAVSWRDGRLVAARNKGHLKNKGENALDIKGVATKFAGRGELEKAYNFAMNDLSKAIKSLSENQRDKIFKGGACFMNLEVIYPTSVNVIPYGQALLVFHGTMEFNVDGIAIGENQEAARTLAGMIKQVNADVQSAYTISGPPINQLPKSKDLRKLKGSYNSKISKLQSKYKLKDTDGIADYHQAFWMDFVNKKSPTKLDNRTLMGLVKRWAFYNKSFRLDKKNLPDVKTLEWAKGIDKNDHAKMAKDNIRPFEDIFLGIGADILSFMSSVLAANPKQAVRDMKKQLDKTIKDVKKSGDVKKINKLKMELQRLNAIGGTDKIVPNEGIVFVYGGKTFKLTGTFAPLNQILGLFYE